MNLDPDDFDLHCLHITKSLLNLIFNLSVNSHTQIYSRLYGTFCRLV